MGALQLIAAIVGLVLLAGCTPAADRFGAPALARSGSYTDKQLYADITAEVARGRSYYAAATKLHRTHGYPLKPSFTVRLPTLAWLSATLGWSTLAAIAYAVTALVAAVWFLALRTRTHRIERLAAAGLIALGAAMLAGHPVILHERWAGLFLALALGLRLGWREAWPSALVAAGIALAIRELAMPFVLLAWAVAMAERRWLEVAGWSALVAAFALALAVHMQHVAAWTLPTDLVTQGWAGAGGAAAAVQSVIYTSPLQYLPAAVAVPLAVLPLLGWIGLGGRDAGFCLLLFGGYALMIALFARPDTFYWGAIVQPAWFVGLAFLPRLVLRLRRWSLDKRRPAPNLASADAPL